MKNPAQHLGFSSRCTILSAHDGKCVIMWKTFANVRALPESQLDVTFEDAIKMKGKLTNLIWDVKL